MAYASRRSLVVPFVVALVGSVMLAIASDRPALAAGSEISTISNPSALEGGDSGTTNVTFVVTATCTEALNVIIDWRIDDGTATTADNDYDDATGQLDDVCQAAGTETFNITVSVNGDTNFEANETFDLVLVNPSIGTPSFALTADTGTATILNDDAANQPPAVTVDQAAVTVGEGSTALNGGTVADPDGDQVTISASVGSVTNNGDGTWSWSYPTTDGPDESQTVTITADDGSLTTSTAFQVVVMNVAPSVAADNASVVVAEGATAANTGTFSDPGADTVTIGASVGTVTQGAGTWSWSYPTTDGFGDSQTATITATDSDGASSATTFDLGVTNVAPTADAGPHQTVFRFDPVTVTGTWTDPAGSADDDYSWSWDLDGDAVVDDSGTAGSGSTITRATSFALEGVYTLTFGVTDKDGASDSDTVEIEVLNQPPVCTAARPSVGTLWPPNHRLVDVAVLAVTDPEGDPIVVTIDSIFQDEPVGGLGDGNTAPDGFGVGTSTASVRAERDGAGNGRVYHVAFTAGDGHGGSCSSVIQVSVPVSQRMGGAFVDDGALFDSTAAP